MPRAVLIILDGLNFQSAAAQMGYMRFLCAKGAASLRLVKCCRPSLSRPLYAALRCGKPPQAHGIMDNECARPLACPDIFSLASAAGLVTAAAPIIGRMSSATQADLTPDAIVLWPALANRWLMACFTAMMNIRMRNCLRMQRRYAGWLDCIFCFATAWG